MYQNFFFNELAKLFLVLSPIIPPPRLPLKPPTRFIVSPPFRLESLFIPPPGVSIGFIAETDADF